jgi:hypothetical protein
VLLSERLAWEAFRPDITRDREKNGIRCNACKLFLLFYIFKDERVRTCIDVYAHKGIIEGETFRKAKLETSVLMLAEF